MWVQVVGFLIKAHIRPSIFRNIFSGIEKAVNTVSISKKD